jgi:type I restriction enzyme S subunit
MKFTLDHFPIGPNVTAIDTWSPQYAASDDEFDYIDIASVDREAKSITGTTRILASEAPSRARQIVQAGDILVSTVRPNLNAVAMVPKHLTNAIASTGFCVLRCHPKKLDHRYLFHWVRTEQFVGDMVRQATGASYPAVSDRIIKDSKIPMPPLPEQKRIADILDKADAIRRKRREARNIVDDVIPSLFREMFGDPRANRYDLQKQPLRELIRVKSGEFLPQKNMNADGPHAVYGGNGINGRHDEYLFEEPRIVIGRVGVYCGVIHVTEPKSWVTDNALYIAEKSDELIDAYLAEALRLANLNQYASQSGQPLISGSRIESVEILVPPKSLQLKFAGAIKKISQLDCMLAYAATHTDDLFDSLVQRAFRGEL